MPTKYVLRDYGVRYDSFESRIPLTSLQARVTCMSKFPGLLQMINEIDGADSLRAGMFYLTYLTVACKILFRFGKTSLFGCEHQKKKLVQT